MREPYTVELVSTEEGVVALEKEWKRLSAAAENPNVFSTYDWFRVWMQQAISESGREALQPFVPVIRQQGTVVGLAPLVRRRVKNWGSYVRKLEFVTCHADYNELVVGRDKAGLAGAMMNYLAHRPRDWELCDLTELREAGDQVSTVRDAARGAGLAHRPFLEADGCLYMPIDAPWSDSRKKKQLRFARRASLGIEERAAEGFRVRVIDRPDLESNILERIIAVEAQKQVNGQLSAPFIGKYPELFRSLLDALGPQGSIAIVVVEKNEELVAYRFLYRCGSKLWDYQTAYHHAYADLSPGTVLIGGAVDYGYRNGCDEFDFLRGMDDYKQRWTHTFRRNKRILIWNQRWLSRLSAFLLVRQRALLPLES